MKITKITKRIGRKIGLPNFSSVTFETEISADVNIRESDAGFEETVEDTDKKVWELAEKCLTRDIQRWREKVKNGSSKTKEQKKA